MHHHHVDALRLVFLAANLAIAAGYASMPLLVLPYLRLDRRTLLYGMGFFAGCAGTHLWMVFGDHHAGWAAAGWHVVQAVCTWGFILSFRSVLKAARRRTGGGRGTR